MPTYTSFDVNRAILSDVRLKDEELALWTAFIDSHYFYNPETDTVESNDGLLRKLYQNYKDCRTDCWILDRLRVNLQQRAILPSKAKMDETTNLTWSTAVLAVTSKVRHITEQYVSEMGRQCEIAGRTIS
ncbi:MAG: hypothetical protein LQ343_005701 [Gyalolechia ehrenbergii]|nr:MAG: hypothetical protein LQ343_005701 [Gyalolechia ehrenbergii]